jgi:hypothetical protein
MLLYRPVGLFELRAIAESGWSCYSPRLPQQPFFYPVLTREYARHIASEWNTRDKASGYAGFVTVFWIPDDILDDYPPHVVGSLECRELWIPAEDLPSFNDRIEGGIRIDSWHYGAAFVPRYPDSVVDQQSGIPMWALRAPCMRAGEPWVTATIQFPVARGGRHAELDLSSGYPPHIIIQPHNMTAGSMIPADVPGDAYKGVRIFGGPKNYELGTEVTVSMDLMYHPKVSYEAVVPPEAFVVVEGGRIVGWGRIITRIDPPLDY